MMGSDAKALRNSAREKTPTLEDESPSRRNIGLHLGPNQCWMSYRHFGESKNPISVEP